MKFNEGDRFDRLTDFGKRKSLEWQIADSYLEWSSPNNLPRTWHLVKDGAKLASSTERGALVPVQSEIGGEIVSGNDSGFKPSRR